MTGGFADRLCTAVTTKDSRVVLGLDPHLDLLPPNFRVSGGASRTEAAKMVTDFCVTVAEECAPYIVAVKPQVAFFESLGPAGWQSLEDVVSACSALGLLVISDCKRGDIGSTAKAYAKYHLSDRASDGLGADAVTANAYMGIDTLDVYDEFLGLDRGVFALVKTSNPGSGAIQNLRVKGSEQDVYEHVAKDLSGFGSKYIGSFGYSSLGFVVGATHVDEAKRLRKNFSSSLFLVPGFGAQGATASDVAACFDKEGLGAVVNASRSILFAYRSENYASKSWYSASKLEAEKMRNDINSAIFTG